jgi:hypothetical protein
MGEAKRPDFRTGLRGPRRTLSLLAAFKAGAIILADDNGEPVKFIANPTVRGGRRWVSLDNKRKYDSYEVHPEF